MLIIEDSRQQEGKHGQKHKHFEQVRVQVVRSKLPVGDYALPPARAVDTKASMSEIAQNIGGGKEEHLRFINELKLAKDLGCELTVLVENEDGIRSVADVPRWKNPRTARSPKCIQGPRLAKAMATIAERYGCRFDFCKPEEAGAKILEILTE